MRWKTTIILGIILILCGFLFWHFEIRKKSEAQKENIEKSKLLPGVKHIPRFTIETRSGMVEAVLRKWQITRPVIYEADENEIQIVLKSAMEIHYTDVISDSGNFYDFGLAPIPWVRFTAENRTFLLGEETPTRKGVYAAIEGDPRVLLVPAQYRQDLLKVAFDLRDKTILPPIEISKLDSVRFIGKNKKIVLVRKGFRWWLDSPIVAPADNNMVDGTINTFLSMKALEFPAENHDESTLKQIGCEKVGKIELFVRDGAKFEMNILAKFEKDTVPNFVYAFVPDKQPLFEISEYGWRFFKKSVDELRDRNLAKVSDADKFEIIHKDTIVVAGKFENGVWHIADEKGDRSQIEQFLRTISFTRIDSFKNDTKFRPCGWSFRFMIAGDTTELVIGDTVGTEIQVKKPEETEYFLVDRQNILKWCKPDGQRFISRRILEIEPDNVENINVRIGDSTYSFARGKNLWKVRTPQGKDEIEFYKVRSAIDAILKITYTDVFPDTARIDEKTALFRAEIEKLDGTKTTLLIGDERQFGRIAIASDKKEYFIVPAGAISTIKTRLDGLLGNE